MKRPITRERTRQALRSACIVLFTTLATLAALEVILRVIDLRLLREGASERSLTYRYDAELGWAPVPNSSSVVTTARTIHAQHNSLGFRDIEFERDARPAILFIGDSFVWGVDAEAQERFTDLLRSRLPGNAIVNAGVSGYGTDQEYLLLQRIWPTIEPSAVVLVFCSDNDRLDNGTSLRYDGYQKPYFATAAGWHAGVARTAGPQIAPVIYQAGLAGASFVARPCGRISLRGNRASAVICARSDGADL